MNDILGQHDLLLESSSRETAQQHAHSFLAHNDLVRYDSVTIESSAILSGNDPEFLENIKSGLAANRQAIQKLVDKLYTEGAADPKNWPTLQQGYTTKLLHTVIHLLDGFFGVDSAFYNLIDNSNQVTDTLLNIIKESPGKYWLVPVTGTSGKEEVDRVPMLRPFGKEFEKKPERP